MINMNNEEGNNCKATCEVVPLDSLDSLPALRVSLVDDGDVSSPSRYSSCGESDFECYCSANSVMGTPSMCSTITVFNDFTEYDDSGLENFSLEEKSEFNSKYQSLSSSGASDSMRDLRAGFCGENIRTQQNLKFVSSGLELYDNVFAIPMLDASNFMVTKTNQLENVLDQKNCIRKDVEVSEVNRQKELGGDRDCLETLSSDGSDDAGITERYLLSDVNGKCSQSLPTFGGEYEINGRESNMQIGETTGSNIIKPHVQDADKLIENFELKEFYEDVVHEPQLSIPLRDGGLTASTSDRDVSCLLVQNPMSIDRIEVVGARQKKGNVSFSRRLVGEKEYTVYKIKVWSGEDQWEIERRYHDFLTLCHCLKALFTELGRDLPSSWSIVEKESKKIFQNASPGVIVQRSVLLQECLQSILHMRFFSSPPSTLIWFLSPPSVLVSHSFTRVTNNRDYSSLGKIISLIVEIPPCKSIKQMLEAQHNRCAGCHKHFDYEKTLILDFVRTFGWGKPRLCEYTSQLFCSFCHTNETAVLPPRVLHHWDFTHYPVSQLAKTYLDSIRDQPMLCVTAVNPILLSKVPALLHVMSVRKKIGTMLPYVLCPFRRSINKGLGTRRYLLESCDLFALRDLIDLSKGAFAALPVIVETVSRKILKHITHQCIICGDVGLPCSARQDCSDPCSLIFPFQEDEIERCTDCQSIFHRPCFRKLANCCCGKNLRLIKRVKSERNFELGSGLS